MERVDVLGVVGAIVFIIGVICLTYMACWALNSPSYAELEKMHYMCKLDGGVMVGGDCYVGRKKIDINVEEFK